jgi:hypothetical protein
MNDCLSVPEKPADIEDDRKFHFAVLGPDAASESGKPSPVAKRFIGETTSVAKPQNIAPKITQNNFQNDTHI